jgi:carbon-monoxide dehydrogenase small subunit
MSEHSITLEVNGESVTRTVPARRLLADFVRDDLNLTGTKRGCETGTCGACTVLKDGQAVKSCLSLAIQSSGARITTIEGLAQGETLHPVQAAFLACHGLQCGYCTPGFILSTVSLLSTNPAPDEAQIRTGLAGNLCRCTGYSQIVEAVRHVVETSHGS